HGVEVLVDLVKEVERGRVVLLDREDERHRYEALLAAAQRVQPEDLLVGRVRADDEAAREWVLLVLQEEFRLPSLADLLVHPPEVRVDRGEHRAESLFLLLRELRREVDQLLALAPELFELLRELPAPLLLGVIVVQGSHVNRSKRLYLGVALRDRALQLIERGQLPRDLPPEGLQVLHGLREALLLGAEFRLEVRRE